MLDNRYIARKVRLFLGQAGYMKRSSGAYILNTLLNISEDDDADIASLMTIATLVKTGEIGRAAIHAYRGVPLRSILITDQTGPYGMNRRIKLWEGLRCVRRHLIDSNPSCCAITLRCVSPLAPAWLYSKYQS